MAGAFVAVSDDATAAYWNPAGLATGSVFSLLVDRAASLTQFDTPEPVSGGTDETGIIVAMSTNTSALSYYRLRINQIERSMLPEASGDSPQENLQGKATLLQSLITHNVALTGARLLSPGFSVGSTLRYVRGSYGVDAADQNLTTDSWLVTADGLERKGRNNFDLDVGLKFGGRTFQAAFVARNLLRPTFGSLDGSSIRLDRQFRAGLSVRPVGRLLVAADIDMSRLATVNGNRRNVAIGAEHSFGEWLSVRGGTRFNLESGTGDLQLVGAFGFSLALTSDLHVDAQMSRGRDDKERGWSFAARVGY